MIHLILAIATFTLMLVILKLFARYSVDNLQAIVVNYFTAAAIGLLSSSESFSLSSTVGSDWFVYALAIGCLFIFVFNLLALGTQTIGISVTTVANKMSLVIPVVVAFFLYSETPTALKIGGVVLALIGIYLTSTVKGRLKFSAKYLPLVIIIFAGQGLADVLFNHARAEYVSNGESQLFFMVLFLVAALCGSLFVLFRVMSGNTKLSLKNLIWGIALGIPNYYTLDFFFKALKSGQFESSQVYPIVNMGVVVLSSIVGIILFKEQLSRMNWIGILLAILAIAAISF